jgi:hypothetical protein
MFIPRIGQEVIVDFLEGDPDQPIITGRVYNGESMPPYELPAEKTKSAIKSYSSKGGGGFNEIRFEDKKGAEQVFVHGEKDLDVRIKNDRREWIGRDRHLIVKRDKRELVERDKHIIIKRDQVEQIERDLHVKIKGKEAIEIGGSHSLSVKGNVAEEFQANHSEQVSNFYSLKAMNVVIEASIGLTIKAGSSFISINPAGIQISGVPLVLINSGGAPLPGIPGLLVPPMEPKEAEIADNADPGSKEPTYKNQRAAMSPSEAAAFDAPSHNPSAQKGEQMSGLGSSGTTSSSAASSGASSSGSGGGGAGGGSSAGAGGAGGSGGAAAGGMAGAGSSGAEGEESEQKKSWIEIELVDENNKPVPGEKYRVTLPDGTTIAEGTLDEKGLARVDGIDPGTCKVTFPDLDKNTWKPK